MAGSDKQKNAERVRWANRERLAQRSSPAAGPLNPLTVDGLIPGDTEGLRPASSNDLPLVVNIPAWENLVPIPGQADKVRIEMARVGENTYQTLKEQDFPYPQNRPDFPKQVTLPLFDKEIQGRFNLRWTLKLWNGPGFNEESTTTPLRIDRTPPYDLLNPTQFILAADEINDAYLAANGNKVIVEIPAYPDYEAGDNRFHLISEEKTTQGNNVHQVFTTYYADDDLDQPFQNQAPQCQLAKRVETRRSVKQGTSRSETALSAYDTHGNLTEQTQANGVKESYSYFPLAGIPGECPPDPSGEYGFVRSLREKTVSPAPDREDGAPVLRTRNRYALMPPVKDTEASSDWLILTDETLYQVNGDQEQELQRSTYLTHNDPSNALLHGRRHQQAITLEGLTTKTDYTYQKLPSAFAGETVLQTTETLTGFDHGVDGKHTQKVVTLEHSLLHGEPLLTRDDNDVEIRYLYDALLRVTRETVAPDTLYMASRSYRYVLTNADNQQASQEATDVKGVKTQTLFDGLNRAIREQRQDKDNRIGAMAEKFRDTYVASYDALGQLEKETEYDWRSANAADDLVLVSQYRYDDWGEQRSMIRPDGVEEHEVSDPIAQTVTTWIEGMGKTVSKNNRFAKPDFDKRYKLGDDPTDPRVEPISEHSYRYDGLGRTAHEIDALTRKTAYLYDAFDRMVKSTLPDKAVVERRYALHSSEDLPVWIGVNDNELGQQAFDGLDRMTQSITGGRVTEYCFNPGQTQPYKVIRPSLEEVNYVYLPALGEDPLKRTTAGIAATYEYDEKNARLKWTEENGLKLSREYYTTGEIKSETREQPGEAPLSMHYYYSRQARLLKYSDVLEQDQTYDYDKLSGQLKSTTLGTTTARFYYNSLGQPEQIETVDGAQRLEIKLTYDDLGREVLREFDFGAGQTQQLSQVYNEVDGLVQRTLKEGETVLRDETYGYDVRGRLEEYNCSGTQQPLDPYNRPIEMQLFIFDELDNLQRVDTWSPDTDDSPGGRNRARYTYDTEKDPTQLIKVASQFAGDPEQIINLDYDADGNLLHDEVGRSLGYDDLGRLISVSALPGETPSGYRYDPLDKLASQNTGGSDQERFYQGDQLANLRSASNNSTFVSANGVVLAEHQEGADPKSMLLASDDKNTVLCEVGQGFANDIYYSPYGHRPDDMPVSNHLGYNGELRETQTGWYLLGNGYRAFNPLLMRFHSPDSWSPFGEGGLNAYMYCLGNPIKYTDPMGHMGWIKEALAAAGAEVAGTAGALAVSRAAQSSTVTTQVTRTVTSSSQAATSAGKLAGSQTDTVVKSASKSVPSTSAYDVIESIPQPSTSARAPTAGSTESWVSHSNFASSPVFSKAETARPVNGSGYIDQSGRGQMPLPGSSKSAPKPVRAQPKPKPVQAPNPTPKQTPEERVNAIREKEKKAGNRFN
ncbi:RHS repeat-associated core domain-containing protein [Pseudomonas fluorescens]|uniref:Teneurin-like YD-shell domain-containing protein n=1 Tax=Pseudomonas fluorescens TaxID=294 RepID=A0A5E7D041_PSEFL|nr:RHS repeat-associated core domain-containing protein [Pseudomonas fluorescens]VVO00962.1 hypothetical protein PS691_02629 [Pseudomonas fluorescens]